MNQNIESQKYDNWGRKIIQPSTGVNHPKVTMHLSQNSMDLALIDCNFLKMLLKKFVSRLPEEKKSKIVYSFIDELRQSVGQVSEEEVLNHAMMLMRNFLDMQDLIRCVQNNNFEQYEVNIQL